MPSNGYASVVPAHPAALTIYNPSLGPTDETLHKQIVYYFSKYSRSRTSRRRQAASEDGGDEATPEDENERLRQIGLAQGMVSFAKTFSDGEPVDTVETEKSRTILHELEPNWWILARIDLTRLVPESSSSPSKSGATPVPSIEYSSREVSPPYLLLQQLLKAHSIFLLHHAPSLGSLFNSLPRDEFCRILDRFWTRFVLNWDVLLHGNPAVEVFGNMKLAGGGELGIGVGEEEWGSGEREVLEGFIARTEGLVDMMLSRFGEPDAAGKESTAKTAANPANLPENRSFWLGRGACPTTSDGVVFSGAGKLAPKSLTSVSQWMEWIYRYGEGAYGIRDDPKSAKKPRKRRNFSSVSRVHGPSSRPSLHTRSKSVTENHVSTRNFSPGIPPPLIINPGTSRAKNKAVQVNSTFPEEGASSGFGTDTFMKMITLGYGSVWGGSRTPLAHSRINTLRPGTGDVLDRDLSVSAPVKHQLDGSSAGFIIGLCSDPENEDSDLESGRSLDGSQDLRKEAEFAGGRIMSRTLDVQVNDGGSLVHRRLRVVIYLHQPFIFTFLFDSETPSLSSPAFYRSIHYQLGPLQKPLLSSTCPTKAASRFSSCGLYHGFKENEAAKQQIFDVVSDPSHHTVRASLPNIPDPGSQITQPNSWSRLDALNVHNQIINTLIETRFRTSEIERTCKTNRGWWVLWMRFQDNPQSLGLRNSLSATEETKEAESRPGTSASKEAFLIRKSNDGSVPGQSSSKGLFRATGGLDATQNNWLAPGKFAEGIGLDAKRYIEALLNLNR